MVIKRRNTFTPNRLFVSDASIKAIAVTSFRLFGFASSSLGEGVSNSLFGGGQKGVLLLLRKSHNSLTFTAIQIPSIKTVLALVGGAYFVISQPVTSPCNYSYGSIKTNLHRILSKNVAKALAFLQLVIILYV